MNKTAYFPLLLFLILAVLPTSCSFPGWKASPADIMNRADESLKQELKAFDLFNKAAPLYASGISGFDSATFYYGHLLEQDLTVDQKLLIINRIGYIKYAQGSLIDSYHQFQDAIPLVKQVSADHMHMAGMAYYFMGHLQSKFAQSDSALFYLMQGRKFLKEAAGGEEHFNYYLCLEGIGFEYLWNFEDYASAEKYLTEAHDMFDKSLIMNKDSILFNLRYSMSSMYRQKKEFDKALVFAIQAKNLADSINESRSMEVSRSLLSNVYRDLNRWEQARVLNFQAIDMNIANGGRPIDLATYYNNMAFISLANAEYPDGLGYCEKALEILMKMSKEETDQTDRLDILELLGVLYDFRGAIYHETGQHEKAGRDYSECLHLRKLRFGNHHKRVSQVNELIGKYFFKINDVDSALYYYQQALITGSEAFDNPAVLANPLLGQIADNLEIIEVLRDKAALLSKKHQLDPENWNLLTGSLDCLKLCDSLIVHVWNSYSNEEARLYLEDTVHSIYEQAIATAFRLYQQDSASSYLEDIFHFMESSRYRFLSDNLTNEQAFSSARIPASLTGRLRETEYLIKYLTRQKNENPQESDYFNQKLFEKIRQKDRLMDSINSAYPDVARIMGSLKRVTLDALEKEIRSSNSILVQFFSGKENFYILSTDGNQTQVCAVEKDHSLNAGIDKLLNMNGFNPMDLQGYRQFTTNSLSVYTKLIQPLLDDYQHDPGTELIIIPDERLNRISFDALIVSMPDTTYVDYRLPDYLVNHYTIRYAFSSGFLISTEPKGHDFHADKLLAMSYGLLDEAGGSGKGLLGANRELDIIKKQAGGKFIKNSAATETAFKKHAPHYPILHLALHGQAGVVNNDSTMLIFRKSPLGRDDGLLFPEELFTLRLHARLVVLSSCETGTGKVFRGEGVYSMARAFAHAGCPGLITTLWQIPDQKTVTLMENFYKGLRKGLSPGQSLRLSKINYLENTDPFSSHPRFWASFIPLGNF